MIKIEFRRPPAQTDRVFRLIPPACGYWLPEVGDRVQLRNPRFPAAYGQYAVVESRCGLGRVRVRLDNGRSLTDVASNLHRVDLHGPMQVRHPLVTTP